MRLRIKTPYSERRANRCDRAPKVWYELFDWFDSWVGAQLAKTEKTVLDDILPDLFGYYLVALSHPQQAYKFAASRVSRRMVMNICARDYLPPLKPSGFLGQVHRLPLQTDCVDVLVLPHILEFSRQPHEVLREAERVLIAEGHVVILGFNPFSFWMLWRLALGWRGAVPWCGTFRSVSRVRDWLALLGFDVVATHYYFFRPPIQNNSILHKLGFLEKLGQRLWPIFGGGYAIVAKKRVVTLTPLRPRWSRRKRLVTAGLVEPMKPHHKEHYEQDR